MKGKYFYISDMHLFHKNIISKFNRPFDTVESMQRKMAENWIKEVSIEDTVFIVGDVGMYHEKEISYYLKALPGRKYLVTGNHDIYNIKNRYFCSCFEDISAYMQIEDNGRKVVLMHYPMEEWNGYYRGFYHVHGHCHNAALPLERITERLDFLLKMKNRFNASADVNNFTPCTLDTFIERREKEIKVLEEQTNIFAALESQII